MNDLSKVVCPGQRWGRWTVVDLGPRSASRTKRWRCICDCGNVGVVRDLELRIGKSKSCGCYARDRVAVTAKKHGMSRSREYTSWLKMKSRCTDPGCGHYDRYGGRGITVCERWLNSFENFLEDMGQRPDETSLDRVDNSKGYYPGNCRWATVREQQRNQRRTRMLELDGVRQPISTWADLLGVPANSLWSRCKSGWDDERVLTTPLQHHGSRRAAQAASVVVATAVFLIAFSGLALAQDPEDGLVEARLTGDTATVASEPIRPQLVHHDRTTPVVFGASATVIGGIGLVTSFALYIARANYRLRPRSTVDAHTIDSWSTMGAFSFWIGTGSSVLLITSEYALLPESDSTPALAWFAGGGGLILAAVGVGYAVGGTHCAPTATRPGADILLACSSGSADALFGSLLLVSSAPLLNVPLTYLFRKAFAGAPESLSIGPGNVSIGGRF